MSDEISTGAGKRAAYPPLQPPPLIPDLPDDVTLQCIARVPPFLHPYLSLVSKSWRAIVKSPDLYATRSLLNCTEQFLYLNVRVNSSFHWYLLRQNPTNPNRPRTLLPLPSIPSQPIGSAFAVLGSKIYVIGGAINEFPSNCVWIFDCQFNSWKSGPPMRVGREFAAAGTVNGKIYVMGGCLGDNGWQSMNWAEVLDPVEGTWSAVPSPIGVRDKWMHASAVINDRIYAMPDRGGVVYDSATGEWSSVSSQLDMGWRGRAAVVDGVLYCYDYLGRIRGYDAKVDRWKDLKGVEKGLPKFMCGATIANVSGRLFVVWEGKGITKEMEINCAEIDVWKDGSGGLSGSIVWSDVILKVPNRSSIVHCVAVGL